MLEVSWMKKELENEIANLETAMYSRPSEDENVPRIFSKANDEARRRNGGEAYAASDDDDDDDVIIILDSSSESSSPANNRPSSDTKRPPCSPNSKQKGIKSKSSPSPSHRKRAKT